MDYQRLIEECEGFVRAGQGQKAEPYFVGLNYSEIPRTYRLPMANLCRRLGLVMTGLKILSPVVHPESQGEQASSGELAEYAVMLERLGAVQEALSLLSEVNTEEVPDAHLYRAFCNFKSWDYAAAIPDLNRYIAKAQTSYARLIGQVNLAAAYIIEGNAAEAQELLQENISLADTHGFKRLKGNCFELRAQLEFQRMDFAQVRLNLAKAADIFAQENSFDQFFVRKWQSVLTAFETRDASPLLHLRQEAVRREDWETVREADLFRLRLQFNHQQFEHLYFGSPFASYRRRITNQLGVEPLYKTYLLGASGRYVMDLETGGITAGTINTGKQIHRVIHVLLHDLYRPLRVGGIFAEVFRGERFNVNTSPSRVHQLLFRLRAWIRDNGIPIVLQEDQNKYRLEIIGDFAFRLPLEQQHESPWSPYWNQLRPRLRDQGFVTACEIRQMLQLKISSSKRFLKWAVESGKLQRLGENNRSRYKMAA